MTGKMFLKGYLFFILLILVLCGMMIGSLARTEIITLFRGREQYDVLFMALMFIFAFVGFCSSMQNAVMCIDRANNGDILFRSRPFGQDEIEYIKVRRSLFHGIYKIRIKTKNNVIYQYSCNKINLEIIRESIPDNTIIDDRQFLFWPSYIAETGLVFIWGVLFGAGFF